MEDLDSTDGRKGPWSSDGYVPKGLSTGCATASGATVAIDAPYVKPELAESWEPRCGAVRRVVLLCGGRVIAGNRFRALPHCLDAFLDRHERRGFDCLH